MLLCTHDHTCMCTPTHTGYPHYIRSKSSGDFRGIFRPANFRSYQEISPPNSGDIRKLGINMQCE